MGCVMAKAILNAKSCKYGRSVRGVSYKGGWKKGLRHGYGELSYKDGSLYKGSW